MVDRNFDDIAEKFSHNIYNSVKGKIRQAILWQDLNEFWDKIDKPAKVLDAGGGQGIMACGMAALGHQVVMCDISSKMLLLAQEKVKEKQVDHNIQFFHCAAQEIGEHLAEQVDLVMFHAVLEWVSEPEKILKVLIDHLKPGGVLSLMFYNYNGLLFRNIQLGNLPYIDAGMKKKKRRTLSPDNPLHPEQVYGWLQKLDLVILNRSGVRVFNDYTCNKTDDFAGMLALEQRFCRQEPFLSLGRYIHVMAKKQGE